MRAVSEWARACVCFKRRSLLCGFLSMNRSMRMLLISPEVFWPRTSRQVLGFSLSLGSRFLRKRRARAVFAVFESTIVRQGREARWTALWFGGPAGMDYKTPARLPMLNYHYTINLLRTRYTCWRVQTMEKMRPGPCSISSRTPTRRVGDTAHMCDMLHMSCAFAYAQSIMLRTVMNAHTHRVAVQLVAVCSTGISLATSTPSASSLARSVCTRPGSGSRSRDMRYIHEPAPPVQTMCELGSTSRMIKGSRTGGQKPPSSGATAHLAPCPPGTQPRCRTTVGWSSAAPARLKV